MYAHIFKDTWKLGMEPRQHVAPRQHIARPILNGSPCDIVWRLDSILCGWPHELGRPVMHGPEPSVRPQDSTLSPRQHIVPKAANCSQGAWPGRRSLSRSKTALPVQKLKAKHVIIYRIDATRYVECDAAWFQDSTLQRRSHW